MTLKFDRWPWKTLGLYTTSSFLHHFKSISEFKLELQSGNAQFGSNCYFVPCDLEIWWMIGHLFYTTSSFVHYFKSIGEVKLEIEYRNAQFGSKMVFFLSCVTLKFEWPSKTIGHPFYTTLSFVHHFKAMGEFKLELQSGNAQFGSKSAIFLSRVTLKFDKWPWKSIGHLSYAALTFVHHFIAIGKFKLELQSINDQYGSKSMIFFSRVTMKFDGW